MSGSVSGKFQDHYIVLGLEHKADTETIAAAYAQLAEKYRPGNSVTGDQDKFDAVTLAYEVLSDPGLRIEFDKLKGIDHEASNPKFSGAEFFDALQKGAVLRSAVLCLLCDRRRIKPFKPSLAMRNLEAMLHTTSDELSFALWYLKQRNYVTNDDKSSLMITVDGMDQLEHNAPASDIILAMIKPDAVIKHESKQARPGESDQVRDIMNRALSRTSASHDVRPAGTHGR